MTSTHTIQNMNTHSEQNHMNKMLISFGWQPLGLGYMEGCIITIIMGHSHDSFKYPNMLNSKYQNLTEGHYI